MNGAMLLQHAAGVVEHRESVYGAAQPLFEHIACRWSLVLGMEVTSAQVALCLIDLKLARLVARSVASRQHRRCCRLRRMPARGDPCVARFVDLCASRRNEKEAPPPPSSTVKA